MANSIDLIVSKQAQEGLDKLYANLQLTHKELISISKIQLDFAGGKSPQSLEQFTTATKRYSANQKELTAVEKERLRVERALETTQARIATANDKNTQSLTQQKGVLKAVNSEYAKLSQKHAEASRSVQDLIARGKLATQTQKQYNNELQNAQGKFNQLNSRVIQADTAVKKFNRNVGNYPKAAGQNIRSLLGAFGLVSGVYLFASAIKSAFTTVKDFDKANADLAATMGTTRASITSLTNDQKRLGATTKFTATEVAGLQKEFAKLGFSQKEILNATEATLALAAAVDTDLANAAMVAGSTLRGFGLDASEMGRVTDVMASSFTKSALDIENFRESMKYVAPIAAQTGVSIEFATAMLGKLADAGVKGSQAGTSLRRILTEMAKTGLPAAQAFDKVARSGISVTESMDEVGRTAQTALLVLSKSKDGVNDLAKALENAGGAAQKMADEQLKSLDGQLTLLSSAWDGFILSMQSGDGILTTMFKGAIEYLTKFLNMVTNANKSFKDLQLEISNSFYENEKKSVEDAALAYAEQVKKRTQSDDNYYENKRNKEIELANFRIKQYEIELYEAEKGSKSRLSVLEEEEKKSKNILTGGFFNLKSLNAAKKAYQDNQLEITNTKSKIEALKSVIEGVTKVEDANSEATNANTGAKEKNTKATKKNAKAKEDVRFALMGSVEWFEKLKRVLIEEQNQVSTNSDIWEDYQKRIDTVQKSIEAITNATKDLGGVSLDIDNDDYITDEEGDKLIEAGKEFRAMLKEFKQGFIDDFADQSGFSLMIDLLSGGLDKFEGDAVSTALAISEAFQQAFNTISQASENRYNSEVQRLENQRDIAITFAGESSTAKEEIDRQYAERKKALDRKKAEQDKKLAIFNAVINTAQAVVAALPNFVLAGVVGVIGAAQVALISSQTIPAYKDGTDNHIGGNMLINDGNGSNYQEVVETPDGKLRQYKGRNQVVNAPKGTKVYNHDQWNERLNTMLLDVGINPIGNIQPKIEIKGGITKDEMTQIMSKFANKDSYEFNIDENGIKKMITRNGQKVNVLNSRLRLKGKDV